MEIVDSLYSLTVNDAKETRYVYRMTSLKFMEGQAYGVEVEKQDIIAGNVTNIEREEIKLISNNKYKVRNLLTLIHKNQVSPIHLVDVLGEYVDEYVADFDNMIALENIN